MQRQTIAIAGVELELFETGEGPPILFLHNGGGFDPEQPFVRLLSAAHRLIAPSHPGFGRSTSRIGSIPATISPTFISN